MTVDQLAALEAAIVNGSLACELDGKRVAYRSLGEMMLMRERIRESLGLIEPKSGEVKQLEPGANEKRSLVYTVDELARDLGISRANVYNQLRAGHIPSIRIGKRFVIPREAIVNWLRTAVTSGRK